MAETASSTILTFSASVKQSGRDAISDTDGPAAASSLSEVGSCILFNPNSVDDVGGDDAVRGAGTVNVEVVGTGEADGLFARIANLATCRAKLQ